MKPTVSALILIAALCLITSGIVQRNRPVRTIVAGQRSFRRGVELLGLEGEGRASTFFNRAIEIMKPFLEDRNRYDHTDVINCMVLSSKCLENLKKYQGAENCYRNVLEEYPYSRYVAEGYVRIARLYRI